MAGGELFCAWIESGPGEDTAVWAEWFDLAGRPLGPSQRVAPASRTTWNLNAAIDAEHHAWVVFDARVGTRSDELFLARVDKTTAGVARLTEDDGFSSKYPDLALGERGAALTSFDERDGNKEVYLFVAPPGHLKEGLERQARRVTNTPGESIGAYLAWNGPHIGLAWCDNTEGQHDIYFQLFGPDGNAIARARRLTDNKT
jgi:hypothetical protein